MANEKKFLRLETAAETYDMKIRTLRDMCINKKIASVKVKGRWHVSAPALQKLFQEEKNHGNGKKRAAAGRV